MFRPALQRVVPCLMLLAAWASTSIADEPTQPLPLAGSPSVGNYEPTVIKPMTIAQQRARYDADQRMARMQWNKWIGYEPSRPSLPNALTNNEMNPYFFQPVRYRPVWTVWNNGSRIW